MNDKKKFKVKQFHKGDCIMKEGDQGEYVVFISSGRVNILRNIGGKEEIIGTINPGEIIGEMAVVSKEPRNATVMAIEDTEVIVIDSRSLELALISSDLPIVYDMIRQLVFRLKSSEKRNEELLREIANLKE